MRAFAVLVLALATAPLAAQAPSARRVHLGATGGLIMPGAFYWFEGPYESYDLSLSPTLGGFVDYQVAEDVTVGAFLDLHVVNAFDESATMFDIGASLKARVAGSRGKRLWRAVVEVGHGSLGSLFVFDGTSYLTLKGGAQVMIPVGSRQWLVEALLFGGPTGGNDDVTTTFGPVVLVRFGLGF